MFGEVVGPCEPLAAFLAGETFFTGVCSQVTLEFVGPCERLVAEQPVAHERSESGVPAEMGLQVAGLAVHLSASCDVTHVLLRFVGFRLLSRDAVRTLAATAATRHSDLL